MALCSGNPYNFTITFAINELNTKSDLFYIDSSNGFMAGPYGDYVLKSGFLDEPENIKRAKVCQFVWANRTGDYDPLTDSYDKESAIWFLIEGIADSYIRALDYGLIDPKFVDYLAMPHSAMALSPFQIIERLENQKIDQTLSSFFHFLIPSTAFLGLMVSGPLLYWFFSSMISRVRKSPRNKLQLKILSLFYLLFLFFIQQFFGGNLNTEKVIVKADDLLYSKEQVLRTNKEFCIPEAGAEVLFYKNAPVNSLLNKIYEKRNASDPCVLSYGNTMGNFLSRQKDKLFTFVAHFSLNLVAYGVKSFLEKDTFIEENLEIYQSTRTFIVKKNMEVDKRNLFERFVGITLEQGIVTKLYRDLPNYSQIKLEKRGSQNGFIHYSGLHEYVEENTRVTALSFEKLEYLFQIYFALVTAILLLHMVHYCVWKFIIRQTWFYSTKRKLVAFVRRTGLGSLFFRRGLGVLDRPNPLL